MENEEKKEQVEEPAQQATEPLPSPGIEPPLSPKKKGKKKFILLGVIVLVVLVAAAAFYFFYLGSPVRQALATVNGEKITVEQFDKELANVEPPFRDMFKEEPNQFLQRMVMKTLLLQEAKKEGLSAPAKTYKDTDKNALSPEETLIAELMKKKFSKPPEVTKEEIQAFYATFKDRMEGKKLEEVSSAIEQIVRQAKQEQEMETFLGDLQKKAKIEINEDRLKKIAAKPPESNTDEEFKKALASGKPFMVDFGANSCVPCRQMRPILKEVSKEYAGKTQVLVIDVYKYQSLAQEYKVLMIPTLVFFDSKGKEVHRHVGVLEKDKIVAKLKEIGMES